jgi:hypothetical protein
VTAVSKRNQRKSCLYGLIGNTSIERKMSCSKPVRCQKCGKPVGYITLLAKGLLGMQQPIDNVKIVAICMECSHNGK